MLCPVKEELCQLEVEASEKIAHRMQKRELMAQLFAAVCNVKEGNLPLTRWTVFQGSIFST